MPEIKVFFSDGSSVFFHEDQTFQTIRSFVSNENPERYDVSLSESFTLWAHHHDGLIPSFMELLANSMYFFDVEDRSTYYNSLQIVKIETT